VSTGISYVDETWNPVQGCEAISPGCRNCYAKGIAHRFGWELTKKKPPAGVEWTGEVRTVPAALEKPLRWKKPRRVLVPSMGDLFHSGVSTSWIASVFGVMSLCPDHLFLVLTKRPARAARFLRWLRGAEEPSAFVLQSGLEGLGMPEGLTIKAEPGPWPLPNVLIGISVEDQDRADQRFPFLAEIAALGWRTWVSAEPLLGPLDRLCVASLANPRPLGRHPEWIPPLAAGVEFLAVGGETGPGARPCEMQWIGRIVLQGEAAAVRLHVKQLGPGFTSEPESWPQILRRRDLAAWKR